MSVLVPLVQTSAASVPKPVRVRVPAAQTLAGIEVIDEAIEVREAPKDEEAAVTIVLVLVLTTAASEVEALRTAALVLLFTLAVPAVIADASEEVAFWTSDKVANDPLVSPAPVRVRVAYVQTSAAESAPPLEIMESMLIASTLPMDPIEVSVDVATFQTEYGTFAICAAREVEAVSTVAFVLLFTLAAAARTAELSEDVAVSTSDKVASEPDVKPAPVRVRVPLVQTSAASVPKPVRVLVPAAQTLAGMESIELAIDESEAPREDEAAVTTLFVLVLMIAANDEDACSTTALVLSFTSSATEEEETMFDVIWKVLSPLMRSPVTSEPHEIYAGQTPSVDAGVKE